MKSWPDRLALIIALLAVLFSAWVTSNIFERTPHIEDEIAYVWQAQVIAGGNLSLPSPFCTRCFLVPFVVDYHGIRFGKYPLGWPVVLAGGVLIGARDWVNPLLAGITIWLLYLLGKKVFSTRVALLAIVLTLTSPFFLMNAGSLLSHVWGLFLILAFTLSWLDTFDPQACVPKWITVLTAGFTLGALALTRPLTASALATPFFVHGLWLLLRSNRKNRANALWIGITAGMISLLFPLWQYAVTGSAGTNPYTLWWPYDRLGFGPGVGVNFEGHTLSTAVDNTLFSLRSGWYDFFGWFGFSWLFLPFGLISIRKNPKAWLVASAFPLLVLVYMLYWIGSWLFGPRYYFEGFHTIALVTAAGIDWAAGRLTTGVPFAKQPFWQKARLVIVSLIVSGLFLLNLFGYMPARMKQMVGLYGASQSALAPFKDANFDTLQTPALVIVHPKKDWMEYGSLLDLSNPYWNTPFVFSRSRGSRLDLSVIKMFPDRSIYHYYPDEPGKFYRFPKAPED